MEIGTCSPLVYKGHIIGIFIKTSRNMIGQPAYAVAIGQPAYTVVINQSAYVVVTNQKRTTPLGRGRTDSIGYSAAKQLPTNLYRLLRESSRTKLLGHH